MLIEKRNLASHSVTNTTPVIRLIIGRVFHVINIYRPYIEVIVPVRPNASVDILLLAVRLQGCNSFAYNVSWVKRALVMSYITSSELMVFLFDVNIPNRHLGFSDDILK